MLTQKGGQQNECMNKSGNESDSVELGEMESKFNCGEQDKCLSETEKGEVLEGMKKTLLIEH